MQLLPAARHSPCHSNVAPLCPPPASPKGRSSTAMQDVGCRAVVPLSLQHTVSSRLFFQWILGYSSTIQRGFVSYVE